jgi:hypothetical protein
MHENHELCSLVSFKRLTLVEQQQYSQSNEEESYYMTQTNNPYTFYVPDKYDPNHFMPWVHPFTSVIAGPTGSGKSVFVRRFVHNIRHNNDDPNTGSHVVVLWRIPDVIRNRRWSGLSTRFTGLGHPRHQGKTFNHFGRSHEIVQNEENTIEP